MGERADRARALFLNGYNCSQAVVGAFSDLFGMEPETAMRFAEGLGGGIGRMRLTCGACRIESEYGKTRRLGNKKRSLCKGAGNGSCFSGEKRFYYMQ